MPLRKSSVIAAALTLVGASGCSQTDPSSGAPSSPAASTTAGAIASTPSPSASASASIPRADALRVTRRPDAVGDVYTIVSQRSVVRSVEVGERTETSQMHELTEAKMACEAVTADACAKRRLIVTRDEVVSPPQMGVSPLHGHTFLLEGTGTTLDASRGDGGEITSRERDGLDARRFRHPTRAYTDALPAEARFGDALPELAELASRGIQGAKSEAIVTHVDPEAKTFTVTARVKAGTEQPEIEANVGATITVEVHAPTARILRWSQVVVMTSAHKAAGGERSTSREIELRTFQYPP